MDYSERRQVNSSALSQFRESAKKLLFDTQLSQGKIYTFNFTDNSPDTCASPADELSPRLTWEEVDSPTPYTGQDSRSDEGEICMYEESGEFIEAQDQDRANQVLQDIKADNIAPS